MKGDIALAGFLLTAAEWQELDPSSRQLLLSLSPTVAPTPMPRATAVGIRDVEAADEIVQPSPLIL